MSQQMIFSIIAQLLDEGKTPTTALIKSRLPQPQPMAVIIQAMSAWRRNPQLAQSIPKEEQTPAAAPRPASVPSLESLQRRIEQLEQQVAELNRKLSTPSA